MINNKALVPKSRSQRARIISVSGAKGGVGKTFFSVNFAAELREKGYKVLIFDADINLSNVNILLHIDQNNNFKDFLRGKISVEKVIQKGVGGIDAIYVGDDLNNIISFSEREIDLVTHTFMEIEKEYDYIIIDTQAGVNKLNIELITFSDQTILISNPEITALVDLYKMIKFLSIKKPGNNLHIVVNKALSAQNAVTIFKNIQNTVSEFRINTRLSFLGYILFEPQRVMESIQKQTPVLLLSNSGSLRECFTIVTNSFLKGVRPQRKKPFFLSFLKRY